jgi:hypothetical protein
VVTTALVLVDKPPVAESVPDPLVELVFDPEEGALHKYSQPRPGALRILDLGGGMFSVAPIETSGANGRVHDEDHFKTAEEQMWQELEELRDILQGKPRRGFFHFFR